jgi:GNAT superfamily N-acetyltransferase
LIEKLCDENKDAVIEALGKCPHRNLYILADLLKYGFDGEEYEFYCSRDFDDGSVNWVLMKNYSTAQLVVFNDEEVSSIPDRLNGTSIIFCDDASLSSIRKYINIVKTKEGRVSLLPKDHHIAVPDSPRAVISDEFMEISNLICSDAEMGQVNVPEQLSKSMESRYAQSFGRSFVIKADGKIICHVASYAESESYVVLGGVITHPDYRGKGYATSIVKTACRYFQEEGKDLYLFWYEKEASAIYHKTGFFDVNKWCKIFIS